MGVGREGVEAKIKALSMYRGVVRPYPHPRSAEYIIGLADMQGGQWGCEYAEAFECVVPVWAIIFLQVWCIIVKRESVNWQKAATAILIMAFL